MRKPILIIAATAMLIMGCGPRVRVPPKVMLTEIGTVGLVRFESNSEGNFEDYVTEEFLAEIREDQPAARIVELGRERDLLAEIGAERMNPSALDSLGKAYSLSAVITGRLHIGEPEADVSLWGGLENLSVSREVTARLSVKIRETTEGATIWSGSADKTREIDGISLHGGNIHLDADNPDRAYGKLVDALIKEIVEDFKFTWERE